MPHYDTTHESNEALGEYRKSNESQETEILEYFRLHWTRELAASEVWQRVCPGAPLTSVRRAISDLCKAGKLRKTDKKREGIYGRNEFCWEYILPDQEAATQLKLL